MKKKLTASVLCLALLLIMLLGSTLAWFTDESGTTNTMTVGNVKIQQYQKDRSNNAFDPVQKMFPAVINNGLGGTVSKQDGFWNTAEINNEIDNIVTVENIGSEAAYVRTLFAFEMRNGVDVIGTDVFLNVNDNGIVKTDWVIEVKGVKYAVYSYTYANALAAKATSTPSLLQFYLAGHVNNDFSADVGGHYDILVLSQAVQEAGFTSADLAFNAAYPLSETNATAWFANIPTP